MEILFYVIGSILSVITLTLLVIVSKLSQISNCLGAIEKVLDERLREIIRKLG